MHLLSLRVLLLLGVALVTGCLESRGSSPSRQAIRRDDFLVTFWCGPPLAEFTDVRAAQVAAAGFNLVGPPCEGESSPALIRKALDVAARHGLRLAIADPRFNVHAAEEEGWDVRLSAAVGEYAQHPALGAYFVHDEPVAAEFPALAAVVSALRVADPQHLAYVNLLPDYVQPANLGTESYSDYVDHFLSTVKPELLSYDYYPFGYDEHGNEKDRSGFFRNLTIVRERALGHHVPFMLIVLAMPHGRYRDVTDAELRWQVWHAVAFGARGISYFAYWTPPPDRDDPVMSGYHGLIEHGEPTLHYFQVSDLNPEVRAVARQLAGWQPAAVADSIGEVAPPFPLGPVEAIAGGPVTAGLFTNGAETAVLLVNRDYRHAVTASLRLRPNVALPLLFDNRQAKWSAATGTELVLPAGDARLLRWPAM